MRANDHLDREPPISSESPGWPVESADRPVNIVPPSSGETVPITYVKGGRIPPLFHPGIWGDDEDFEPIDVHSLNVVPWKIEFSLPGKVVIGEPWEPLPYPD